MGITIDQHRLMQLPYVKTLPYELKTAAHSLILRGADANLIYFWFNVTQHNYWPMFSVMQVRQDADHMIQTHPDFQDEVNTWFKHYTQFLKHTNPNNLI